MEASNIDMIIAKVRRDLSKYADAGLIDDNELYSDAISEFKRFGNDVAELQEAFVEVKNGIAHLPEQFFSLYLALECEPESYTTNAVEAHTLESSVFYRERVIVGDTWSECDSCCQTRQENVIRENVYFNTGSISFCYKNPRMLRLAKTMQKSVCHSKCKNTYMNDNPNEINIIKKTLQANYNSGNIYMQFYGLPVSEDGHIDIPDSKNGHMNKYIEYFLKRRLTEQLMGNNDSQGLQNLYQIYGGQESIALRNASNELKMSKINPVSLRKWHRLNRLETLAFEVNLPSTWR